jgi:hypothetical protein
MRRDAIRKSAVVSLPDLDEGLTLAILTGNASPLVPHDLEAIRTGYGRRQLSQYERLYDQLVYPVLFSDGTGGCGVGTGEACQGTTTLMRKALSALVLQ